MKVLGTESSVQSPITRVWHAERISPNGQVREIVLVHAVDPEEAERLARECDWTVVRCS